ncbi:histone-lysine N-methyltransferase ASHR3-like [Papaver somniferum]|uniref:histone-lysine N-methyltransferase ASHR3-like n=1 Tax=Papaver somniferum TaxID=3469 RepID=UPI000E70129E|nr:histone-lysine N-methyltransferase ASHR3-like [Papaver somniferum]
MLDVSNLLDSSTSLQITRCPNFLPVSSTLNCDSSTSDSLYPVESKTLNQEKNTSWCSNLGTRLGNPISTNGKISKGNSGNIGIKVFVRSKMIKRCEKKDVVKLNLDDCVKSWIQKKIESGVPERRCFLPFLVNAPKMDECRACNDFIYSGEKTVCSVRGCQESYHETCVREILGFSTSNNFKCPHHACFVCKQNKNWRCIRCPAASHPKCAPWPDKVIYLTTSQPGRAVCWRHPTDWRLEKKDEVPTSDVEEIFRRLPIPYIEEEFQINLMWKDLMEQNMEPPQYAHIKRNVYLVKKKREDTDAGIGCTNCKADNEMCSEECVCRGQSISCSKSCHCSEACTNRPFRKEKKIKVVRTQFCGWGVEAAESLKRGDFVIEYIGEVINDALCEQRLWDIRFRGDENFYMCEIRKDFTIDATFKGNVSRFLNHSCDPNCKLEKWQVDGETRVGVFAAQSINVGEPLTYDYRFVHFGTMVKCQCGSKNCQGYLGTKRKEKKLDIRWGSKRRRSSMTVLEIIRN